MKKIFNFKFQKIRKARKGFTLIELLLYMGIFTILLTVLFQIFTTILSVHAQSQTTSSVYEDGNYILARITYDLHNSSTILAPALGTSCTATATLPTCKLTISDGTKNQTYSITSGNFFVTDGTNTYQLNSVNTTVVSISFTTLGNTGVDNPKLSEQIILNLQSTTVRQGGMFETGTFQTTVQTR